MLLKYGRQEVSERNEITAQRDAWREGNSSARVFVHVENYFKFSVLFTGLGSLINLIYMNRMEQSTAQHRMPVDQRLELI